MRDDHTAAFFQEEDRIAADQAAGRNYDEWPNGYDTTRRQQHRLGH